MLAFKAQINTASEQQCHKSASMACLVKVSQHISLLLYWSVIETFSFHESSLNIKLLFSVLLVCILLDDELQSVTVSSCWSPSETHRCQFVMMTGCVSGRNMLFSEHKVFDWVTEQGNTQDLALCWSSMIFIHCLPVCLFKMNYEEGGDVLSCITAVCCVLSSVF